MAELIREGCLRIPDVQAELMSVDQVDKEKLQAADAIFFGSPTYYGTMSWQMKKLIDNFPIDPKDKIGAVFASANWPGGGGSEMAELSMIAGLLVMGMIVYSGGTTHGQPGTHFGAVSTKAPQGVDAERCIKLGERVAALARSLSSKERA
jgi:NAD(P)H dehydrogenase (quinone)